MLPGFARQEPRRLPYLVSCACWLAGADAGARKHRMSGLRGSLPVLFLLYVLPVGVVRKGAEREGAAGRGPHAHGLQAVRPCARRPLSPAGASSALSSTAAGQRSHKPKCRKGAKGPKGLKVQGIGCLLRDMPCGMRGVQCAVPPARCGLHAPPSLPPTSGRPCPAAAEAAGARRPPTKSLPALTCMRRVPRPPGPACDG